MIYSADFDSINNVAPGKHFYQFYKQAEDYLRIMIPFFQAGLGKGEACIWLVSKKIGVQEVLQYAALTIPNCAHYLETKQFKIASAEDWYLTAGAFDETQAISNALSFLDESIRRGFKVIRGCGDAGAIPFADWDKVMAYEAKMSSWIKANPVIALCAFPILECSLTRTKAILDEHDDVLVSKI